MNIIKRIEKVEITVCTVLYAAMVLICFANVCSRFLFHFSFAFAEELELIAFIWSIMIGIAIGYNKGVHLGVTFITDLLKGVPKLCAVIFSGAVSAGFMGLLFYQGVQMVRQQISSGLKTPALSLPQWVQGLAIPVGAVLVMISIVFVTVQQCRQTLHPAPEGQNGKGADA